MNRLSRSTALKFAALLSLSLCAVNIIFTLSFGADPANLSAADGPGFSGLLFLFGLGTVGAVAAYGTWKQMRWGIILTILVNLFNGLSAAPGVLFAGGPVRLFATTTVALSVVVIVLCLRRDRKPVTA